MTNRPRATGRLRLTTAAVTAARAWWPRCSCRWPGRLTRPRSVQYGKVVFVDDGDTIDVDVAGDGTSRPVRIRYIGIQAMELSVYSHTLSKLRGECWGVDAAKNLHRIRDRQAGSA